MLKRTKVTGAKSAGQQGCGARLGKAGPGTRATIRTIAYGTGRRAVLLRTGQGGLPNPYVAAHLLDMAMRRVSPRTATIKAIGIHRGLEFCAAAGIDVVDRCRATYLADPELAALALHFQGVGVRSLAMAGAHYAAFVEHLVFTGARLHGPRDPETRTQLALFLKSAKKHRPVDRDGGRAPRLGLTEQQRDLLLSASIPTHPGNPFGATGFRNFVVIRTAYELGLRSGEILALKMADLDLGTGEIRVERRAHDPEEGRQVAPLPKTLSRTLPLSPDLAQAYAQLIEERRRCKAARKHRYLFVNSRGLPLTERGLRTIFEDLRDAFPDLGDVTVHKIRHDWNDRWNEAGGRGGPVGQGDASDALRAQADAMGWKPGSKMPDRYGRRSLEAIANARILRMQERGSSRRGKRS